MRHTDYHLDKMHDKCVAISRSKVVVSSHWDRVLPMFYTGDPVTLYSPVCAMRGGGIAHGVVGAFNEVSVLHSTEPLKTVPQRDCYKKRYTVMRSFSPMNTLNDDDITLIYKKELEGLNILQALGKKQETKKKHHVVRICDHTIINKEKRELVIFMEQLDPLPSVPNASILVSIITAVQFIHHYKCVHGDLKPDNIMCPYGDHDHAVLVDFGLSFTIKHNYMEPGSSNRLDLIVIV